MTQQDQSYQVLARKYRPQSFDQLVGQEVLVQTLTNSIKHNKIAHAFILTGIRGVGKTTTARIIAKALNCVGEKGDLKEAAIPCGACDNCLAITKSNFYDVIEIDAASRTGVDDMRSIIDSINYSPTIGRYKVYIIDEVHMLSNNAFNALLKTLEEPPAHTKFIFATTEIKKIPITVLSRCQRFDLRRLSNEELVVFLRKIVGEEGYKADERALSLIANASQGSVRDSLSILDRALSCNNYEPELPCDLVESLLCSNDKSFTINLFNSLIQGDVSSCLSLFDQFYQNSSDITSLNQDLLEINHRITLSKSIKSLENKDLSKSQIQTIEDIAAKSTIIDLARIWQILLKGASEITFAKTNPKLVFEMLLIRICHLKEIPNFESLLNSNTIISSETNSKASPDPASANESDDFSGEILRNFNGAKVVS